MRLFATTRQTLIVCGSLVFALARQDFAEYLMRISPGSRIQDKTGLPGRHDFSLALYDAASAADELTGNPLDRIPLNAVGLTLKEGKGPSFALYIKNIKTTDPN